MQKGKFPLSEDHPPAEAYDRAMRHGLFYYAAQIARDYGLGDDLVRDAAFKAYCRFDKIGDEICKLIVLAEFGFAERVVILTEDGIFRDADRGFPSIVPGDKNGASRPN